MRHKKRVFHPSQGRTLRGLVSLGGLILVLDNQAALLDTRLLTGQLAEVVDTCTTYNTTLVYLDLVEMWRVEREDTLNAHAVRYLADGEHLGLTLTLNLDHYTTEALQTLFASLNDTVGNSDGVTCLERRDVGISLLPHLIVHESNQRILVHCCNKIFWLIAQHCRCGWPTIRSTYRVIPHEKFLSDKFFSSETLII